ncbi:hypothetical protein J5N97_015275 [Dioscorea zingiberensis]|uniref:Zinc finger CCCH domain-containing protein 4 n=1 Tax=Dioscorea zingiberensis TaxID=325984 RepID=A0A9D5HKH9_9LILI|nr:hypothetical protein J5N97_015275 [Dioscorea zingiberensis]
MAGEAFDDGASSSASAAPPFGLPHPLPVMAMRDKILEKIQQNRVTLIVGETGCGKSSQVPQFLLEENVVPILCTQPRRLAVVAIARMVAKARNCEVGGEVGYHIGHSNVSDIASIRSKLVFKTAGVLLEQIRDKGAAALNYKIIILDEVHERSVESDLVLASVKQFLLRKKDFRLVLMSATADIARYRDYFKELGRSERVEVIAIPTAPKQNIFQRRVLYLEQVAELLGFSSNSLSETYCCGLIPSLANACLKPEVHSLIHQLVLHINANELDIEKSILIFLPNYHALEQQWILLKPLYMFFEVHILHRSVDIDHALLAMRICKSHRKVILATNIAESSVTIPEVAFVIDSCRSLQVFWDPNRKTDLSELVWVSKSQAEQRKGRTGRTCDGQIYRLVTRKFYDNLSDHEFPAISRLSLRQQVLMMCCTESKAINDPKVLLQKVLDPPDPEVVEDALNLLLHIHALEGPSHRGRYEPTYYGHLLDSLPLTFDSSVLTLKFGEIGLLREGILIGILMDILPLPILQPFAQQVLCTQYIDNYFDSDSEGVLKIGKKESIFIGNLCAFQFWQRVFKDKQRLESLKHIVEVDEAKTSQTLIPMLEEEWCSFHNLVQTSLHIVDDLYEDIVHVIHKYRPKFIATNRLPSYLEPYTYKHSCVLQSKLEGDDDTLAVKDEDIDPITERRCVSTPFVTPTDFQATAIAERLKNLIKEIRVQYTNDASWNVNVPEVHFLSQMLDATLCRFFITGSCNKGNQCSFSHSLEAKRPTCKFFHTLQGCRNGASCFFSHDSGPISPSICLQENEIPSAYPFLQLLPAAAGCILVMNDKNLLFSSNLSKYYNPSNILVTTPQPYVPGLDTLPSEVEVFWNVISFCNSIVAPKEEVPLPWAKVQTVLWFAEIEDDEGNIQLSLQNFFAFLAIRILAETLQNVQVILIMNNIKFAQFQVEKLARECFFFLTQSFPYDTNTFGKISDTDKAVKRMQVSLPITYVFDMHPPSDIQFRDYAVLRKGLYNNN